MNPEDDASTLEGRLRALLRSEVPGDIVSRLGEVDPELVAEELLRLGREDQQTVLRAMPIDQAAEVFHWLDPRTQEALAHEVELPFLTTLITTMEPDDAADLVGMLEEPRAEGVLSELHDSAREQITALLSYPPDTAGGLMDPDVVRARENETVAEALADVRRYVDRVQLDNFFSLFVVTEEGSLVGVVPNWRMLLAQPEQYIREIMDYGVTSVPATMDQEEVIRLVRARDLVSVPVVDEQNHLIGRITHDDIVDVIHEEFKEDLGHLTGTRSEEARELSLLQTIRLRFPWLLAALVGEFLLAVYMTSVGDFLASVPQLAFFFPLIMAMGGTSGVQSSSLVIRGLATGEVSVSHFWRRIGRELLVSLGIGILFAIMLLGGGFLLTGDVWLALAVGLATAAGILLAATGGSAIPIVLRKLGVDPALATGPFITTLNDILGILVYIGIAYLLII